MASPIVERVALGAVHDCDAESAAIGVFSAACVRARGCLSVKVNPFSVLVFVHIFLLGYGGENRTRCFSLVVRRSLSFLFGFFFAVGVCFLFTVCAPMNLHGAELGASRRCTRPGLCGK